MIRLDKYVADARVITRKEAVYLIRKGLVTVDGIPVRDAAQKVDPLRQQVTVEGQNAAFSEYLYILMNKPAGCLSASSDSAALTVLSLLPPVYAAKGVSCVGRLDKDTTGLLLLTNDGALAHKLTSPKSGVKKRYRVTCDKPFTKEDKQTVQTGIVIEGKRTAPAVLELTEDPYTAYMTLTEGKFHEVKRLCYASGEKTVTALTRVAFGPLTLDETLPVGAWRSLSPIEIAALRAED